MYDLTARLAALGPPGPGETALFEALSHSQPDADRFIAMLAGVVPVRDFMSPRSIVGLVGVRGFARLVAGQARRGRPPGGPRGRYPAPASLRHSGPDRPLSWPGLPAPAAREAPHPAGHGRWPR
jgi:hypothetical protein